MKGGSREGGGGDGEVGRVLTHFLTLFVASLPRQTRAKKRRIA